MCISRHCRSLSSTVYGVVSLRDGQRKNSSFWWRVSSKTYRAGPWTGLTQKEKKRKVHPARFATLLGVWRPRPVRNWDLGLAGSALSEYPAISRSWLYLLFPTLSTCYNHSIPIGGVGNRRRTLVGPWWCKSSTRHWNYLEDYWPCAGGLSAVKTMGTQLRGPINSRLAHWRMAVWRNKRMPPRKLRGVLQLSSTRFSLNWVLRRMSRTGQPNSSRETKFSGASSDRK